MKSYEFIIQENNSEQRLDQYLTLQSELGLSRSRIQSLLKEGQITVNGLPVKAKYAPAAGDKIIITVPDPVPLQMQAQDIPLDIIFEDESLLVINKPVGLVVHPGAGNYTDTMVNALLAHCDNLSGIGGVQRPGIVHRLDKDTSGLLIVAKNDAAHNYLSEHLAKREISRQYLTVVGGNFTYSSGTVDLPIGRHNANRQKMTIDTERGKTAVTHYQVKEQFNNSALLLVKLDTGRTHQIRVHMSHIRHPVIGDKTYGRWSRLSLLDETGSRYELEFPRQALHAAILDFTHPLTHEPLHFEAPLPLDMLELIKALRIDSQISKKAGK